MLSQRTETILKSIVEQYISRAAPVPSQSVLDNYGLHVSSATIRNEMAHLEQEGYIIRPHTSAGSVPSDKGYRHYVETLNEITLPLNQQRMISHIFHQVETKLEEWVTLTARILAEMAQNMAIVVMPKPVQCRYKYLEIVTLRDSVALIILVLHGAKIKQQLVTLDELPSQVELFAITNKFNHICSEKTSSEISEEEIALSPLEAQIKDCLLKIMEDEDNAEYVGPYLDGLHFMFNQPEFTDTGRVIALMELTEQRNLLKVILPHRESKQGVQVVIGKENEAEVIQNCSVIISEYGLPEEAMGNLAIIGPTRLPYARCIASIDYLSSLLSVLICKLYGKKEEDQR